jgi:hypothetical protein
MDDTYNKHAYRCLPLSWANVNGWEVILQQDLTVVWDGGTTIPHIIDGEYFQSRQIANCNKVGMVDIHIGWAFGTEPGMATTISQSPNFFLDGAQALTACIPSSWWPDEVQMSWRITKVGEPVVFPAGMPFAFFQIFDESLMPNAEITIENLWDKPLLIEERMAYSDAKMKKHREEPWTWMNGIRTGLNEKGQQIGPRHEGLVKLSQPFGDGAACEEIMREDGN